MDRDFADLQKNVAGLQARARSRRVFPNLCHLSVRPCHGFVRLPHVDTDPAVARVAEAHIVAANFFRGIDRQRVTGRSAVHAADENADHFTFEIEERRARFAALRGKVDPQVGGREVAAKIFSIEAGDHSETGRPGQIERITNRHHWCGQSELGRFADRKKRRRRVDFEERDAAAKVRHQLRGVICFPSELNGKIIRFAADGIGGVDRAGRINKKPGAGEFAVFVDRVNFDDRVPAAFEDGLDLAADRAGRVLLRAKDRQTNEGEQSSESRCPPQLEERAPRGAKN